MSRKTQKFRDVAEQLHELGPKIIAANGHDIKIGCENKDYQRLFEKAEETWKKDNPIKFEADKDAYRYAMWEKIINQAKFITAHGGGHIPITCK